MFFSAKSSPAQLSQALAKCLADFFKLDAQQTAPWISLDSDKLHINLPFVAETLHPALSSQLQAVLSQHKSAVQHILINSKIAAAPTRMAKVGKIKNIIAVASGKGGVGKSTTAVNLALALQAEGARVGVLDADIYGPSIPIMLGNPQATPASEDQQRVEPMQAHGLVASSIGYFVPAENATVWRGPMASKALAQLLNETNWPELDYLIVDMPPGTGDIQLTLAQQMPVSAALVVTTPQDLALADATKGIAMFNKVNVPVLGIVENMSYHICSHCGHREAIFAEQGGDKLAKQNQLPLLAQLPLDITIRSHADGGTPLQISQPEHALSETYRQLARNVSQALSFRCNN